MPKISFRDWIRLGLLILPYIKRLSDYIRKISKEDIKPLQIVRDLLDMIWQQQVLEPADGSGPIRFANLRDLFFSGLATAEEALDTSSVEGVLKDCVGILVEFLQDRGYIKRSERVLAVGGPK